MKLLLVFTVIGIAFHVTHCFRVREPVRESSENEYKDYVFGGQDAREGSAPYQVSLQLVSGIHYCSGAIINNSWILTAAHCLDGWDPDDFRISSGSVDLRGNNSYHFADKFVTHPYYDYGIHQNDIGLVHLKSPLEWNETTSPIQIATEELLPDSKVLISGWGQTENDSTEWLQIAEVNYMPYKRCKEEFQEVDVGNICTFLTKGVGTCFGDSGGPVVSTNYTTVVGIVSWGRPCAEGSPDVHANAFFYHDWVRSTMRGWI